MSPCGDNYTNGSASTNETERMDRNREPYRIELDGLRSLAVTLVILFHLDIRAFSGGYIGVDVFFVISGFLISRILVSEMHQNSFSFKKFYVRRIARLLPALLVTIMGSLAVALFIMTPQDLVYSCKQAIAAIFSVSNILYVMEKGYWDPTSHNKLLLHTWSLGVEEQFYLIFPLLIYMFYRIGKLTAVTYLFVGLSAAGTAASIVALASNPSAAFYLTPFRMFEFAIGGIGALVILRGPLYGWLAPVGTASGLAIIITSSFVFTETTTFPGLNALLVSVGAVAVIVGGQNSIAKLVLSNRPMVLLGRWSYSLYLIHWPLIVLFRYIYGPAITISNASALLVLTILLGWFLHAQIEQRFRLKLKTSETKLTIRWRLTATASLAFVVSNLSLLIIEGQGWAWRMPEAVLYLASRKIEDSWHDVGNYYWQKCGKKITPIFCGEHDSKAPNIILLADSRGLDIFTALKAGFPSANIYTSFMAGCAPVFDENVSNNPDFPGCPDFNRQRFPLVLDAPKEDTLVLAMNFDERRAPAIVETARRFVEQGRRVFVVGQTNYIEGENPLDIAVKHRRLTGIEAAVNRNLIQPPFSLDDKYSYIFTNIGATYIENRDFFELNGQYRIYTRDDKDLLMYDKFHLTLPGALEYAVYISSKYPSIAMPP